MRLLFIPIFFELVIGGGGRYFEIGPVTVRMIFFGIAITLTLLYFSFIKKINKGIFLVILFFILSVSVGFIVGYFNNATIERILQDIKPLSYFFMLLFFSLIIKDMNDIILIGKIIKVGSLIMAIIYIVIIFMLFTGKINFQAFWLQQSRFGEIFFRNDLAIFYKGFLYLCIGFFFIILTESRFKIISLLLLFSAIVLSLTRGFILFTVLITCYYIFFINKNVKIKFLVFILVVATFIYALPIFFKILGSKSESDSIRFIQINQVISSVTPVSLIVGHGFGIGVPIRPIGMELSFLEIFHKQGVLGVLFWLVMFFYIFLMYANININEYKKIGLPFLLSVIFVILQSGTNPYMNNPIGLSIILITIVVFSKLLEFQRNHKNDISLHGHL
jgi:hypothetical protein